MTEYSDVNPPAPVSKAEAVQKTVTRISYRYGQVILAIVCIVIGFVMGKL